MSDVGLDPATGMADSKTSRQSTFVYHDTHIFTWKKKKKKLQ
jgi:hypothetical protein